MTHPIENIMRTSMEHIKQLADVNTVIGSPILSEDDTMILPVSKVSLGMLVGGGEYPSQTNAKKASCDPDTLANYPFIGASTLGMSLTPLAFLSVSKGSVRVLPARQDCSLDRFIDMVPQIIDAAERIMGGNEACCTGKQKAAGSRFHGARMDLDQKGCGSIRFSQDENKEYPVKETSDE